jgi:hypothetical protein
MTSNSSEFLEDKIRILCPYSPSGSSEIEFKKNSKKKRLKFKETKRFSD